MEQQQLPTQCFELVLKDEGAKCAYYKCNREGRDGKHAMYIYAGTGQSRDHLMKYTLPLCHQHYEETRGAKELLEKLAELNELQSFAEWSRANASDKNEEIPVLIHDFYCELLANHERLRFLNDNGTNAVVCVFPNLMFYDWRIDNNAVNKNLFYSLTTVRYVLRNLRTSLKIYSSQELWDKVMTKKI